jgi:hypothetical protein
MTPAAESSGFSCVVSESSTSAAADEAAAPELLDSIESAAELFGDD